MMPIPATSTNNAVLPLDLPDAYATLAWRAMLTEVNRVWWIVLTTAHIKIWRWKIFIAALRQFRPGCRVLLNMGRLAHSCRLKMC